MSTVFSHSRNYCFCSVNHSEELIEVSAEVRTTQFIPGKAYLPQTHALGQKVKSPNPEQGVVCRTELRTLLAKGTQ